MTQSQRILSPQRMPIPPYPLTLWTSLKSIILTSNVISLYCILITCYCYNRLQPTIRFRSLAMTKSYTRDYGSLSFCHLIYPLSNCLTYRRLCHFTRCYLIHRSLFIYEVLPIRVIIYNHLSYCFIAYSDFSVENRGSTSTYDFNITTIKIRQTIILSRCIWMRFKIALTRCINT